MFNVLTINIGVELFGILICLTVILCKNFIVGSHQQKTGTLFTLLVFCEALALFSSAMCGILTGKSSGSAKILMNAFCYLRYSFEYILLGLFTNYVALYFQYDKKNPLRIFTFGLVLLGIAVLTVNLFVPIFYYIGEGNEVIRSKAFRLSYFLPVIICIEDLLLVMIRRRNVSEFIFASFIMYILFPAAAIVIQIFFVKLDLVNIALIIVLMYMFVVMQNQLVNEYIEQKKALQENRTKLMLSQIKPHFLFNSLTSIAQLCDDDPALAKSATIAFANYLRGNLASIDHTGTIPFKDELVHIKNYLRIEQIRFGDMLRIEYDIETVDFEIPPLSIQPLIENAVKHGVGMKEDGGTVSLSVHKEKESIIIKISDDGVGFDSGTGIDSRSHIGISSSKERLKSFCGAKMTIDSAVGKGTGVTVTIPV